MRSLPVSESATLAAIAARCPAAPAPAPVPYGRGRPGEPFDLDGWLAAHCPELGAPTPWQGGRKWVFPVCPWNEDHTNRAAFVVQFPHGAVDAGCHHNGCQGRDWFALRELREPGYQRYDPTQPYAPPRPGGGFGGEEPGARPPTLDEPAPVIVLPHAPEAEVALMGLLAGPEAGAVFGEIQQHLAPTDYYLRLHERIYGAAGRLAERGEPVDRVTLAGELAGDALFVDSGGLAYLDGCAATRPQREHAAAYAKRVAGTARARRLHGLLGAAAGRVGSGEAAPEVVMAELETRFFDLRPSSEVSPEIYAPEAVQAAVADMMAAESDPGRLSALSTGLAELDRVTGGLQKGNLIIVAGRPGTGKTSLALNMAEAGGACGRGPSLAFSLEMSRKGLAYRLLADRTDIPATRLSGGQVYSDTEHGDEWAKIMAAASDLSTVNIWLNDTPGIAIGALAARAQQLQHRLGLSLVLVDYLTLVRGGKHASPYHEVTYIARSFQRLARELDVPVVVLSQLNRRVEHRQNRQPLLSDLLESGEIEAAADLVLMLSREGIGRNPTSEYDSPKGSCQYAEVLVAKNRNGQTGTVQLLFEGRRFRFQSAAGAGDAAGEHWAT